jgi:YggT family protein
MFIVGNFLSAVAVVLDAVLTIYMWIIIIAALITWVNPDPYNPIVRFLHAVTEPLLRPIRRMIGYGIGIDFSPMVVILGILFVKYFLVRSLQDIAFRLR